MRFRHFLFGAALTLLVPRLAEAAVTFNVTNQGTQAFLFDAANPNGTLTLFRGQTYIFNVTVNGHPFHITTAPGLTPVMDFVDAGLTGQGAQASTGALTFTVSANAPSSLFYQCSNHVPMTGSIIIPAAANVPATNRWALVGLGALLVLAGGVVLRRRRSSAR